MKEPLPSPRTSGDYRALHVGPESVRCFIPHPLPPRDPPLDVDACASDLAAATAAIERFRVVAASVPDLNWFLYGFVRKEALQSSRIEGTQATLRDVATFEADASVENPDDVEEVCNYVKALTHARKSIASPSGLPLSTRLLCEVHRLLMQGVRGADRMPGEIRQSQNWIGGSRPGNARYVPPPPEDVPALMAALEQWIHGADAIPPLIKAGLAHVQFESIHPFLDGNGRVGRMLITLLLEHWSILDEPLLYLSLALKRRQRAYYDHLTAVRDDGDWEGWTSFFLSCVQEAADDAIQIIGRINAIISEDRAAVLQRSRTSIASIQLFERLPSNPVVTAARAAALIDVSAPTARKAIDQLQSVGVLEESTGLQRDRVWAYRRYLDALTGPSD